MTHKSDPAYLLCTEKEQAWLDYYAISHDVTEATLQSYEIKDRVQARTYGLTVMGRPRMAALIKEYITPKPPPKLPTSEELRAMYIEIFNNPDDNSRVRLQALTAYERVSGFSKPKPNTADDVFNPLDDIVG